MMNPMNWMMRIRKLLTSLNCLSKLSSSWAAWPVTSLLMLHQSPGPICVLCQMVNPAALPLHHLLWHSLIKLSLLLKTFTSESIVSCYNIHSVMFPSLYYTLKQTQSENMVIDYKSENKNVWFWYTDTKTKQNKSFSRAQMPHNFVDER